MPGVAKLIVTTKLLVGLRSDPRLSRAMLCQAAPDTLSVSRLSFE
jgi:hypothetical protein